MMSTDNALHPYTADHELGELLKEAVRAGVRLRVRAGDEVYELEVKPSTYDRAIWAGYDPQAARTAWHALAGVLEGVDAEELIRELRAAREQHSSGRVFP